MTTNTTRTMLPLSLAIALALGAGGVVMAQNAEAPAVAAVEQAEALPPFAEIGPKHVLFTAMGREWTREDFEGATRFFPPPSLRIVNELEVPFDEFLPSQIATGIGELLTNLKAGELARERGIEIPSPDEFDAMMRDVAIRLWLKHHGVMAATKVTDEDFETYRQENRERLMQEEILRLRHMFFPAYEEVTVEEGDTLESISERINGDRVKASHILVLETREPRAGADAPDTGQTVPDEPLVAGELLLVPMGEERAAEVEAMAIAGWERVSQGEDFIEVARELTGNPNAAGLITVKPATDAKPILAPLREAFEALGDGEFSKPVRTRHGFQVVYRESYQPHELMSVEQVRSRHLMDLRQEKAFAAYMKALKEVWSECDAVEVNEEALMAAGDEGADPAAVIINVDGSAYTLDRFVVDHGEALAESDDAAARRALLIEKFQPLQQKVMLWDIERMGIRDWRDYELAAELVEATMLTPIVIQQLTEERFVEPTDEDLRARFENDSVRFTQVPSAYVWRISVTADTNAAPGTEEYRDAARRKLQELSAVLAEIQDVTQFEQIAREMSEDEFATMGGRVGRVNSFQEDGYYKDVIERTQGRGPLGPIIKGRDLQGYWVEEVFDTSETAFRDVRELVRHNEITERRMRLGRTIEREFKEQAGLKLRFAVDEE